MRRPRAPRNLDGASACHMCGRCAGFRDAIVIRPRAPGSEVVRLGVTATSWDRLLTICGLMGVAPLRSFGRSRNLAGRRKYPLAGAGTPPFGLRHGEATPLVMDCKMKSGIANAYWWVQFP